MTRCLQISFLVGFLATVLASPSAPAQPAEAPRRIEARVDPRVELLSIVFRYAGNPEYGRGMVEAYTRAADAHFGKHRDHAVVRHAAELRRSRSVSYDAVMGLAVHLDDRFALALPVERAVRLDERWPRAEVPAFLDELRAFAEATDAAGFFRAQQERYARTAARMQVVLDEQVRLGWFDSFFGARPAARFELALGLGNGGNCFGPSVLRPDGAEDLHCVLGVWLTDAQGEPAFDASVVPTVVHEFCHSYCNALMDAHAAALEAPGQQIWSHVAAAMRRQAYAEIRTMMRESLVRACVVRYQAAAGGADAVAREIADQHARSFFWMGELAEVLGTYEQDRAKYPTLDAFMPRIVEFFTGYGKRFAERMAATPKVVELQPANGATDVDPGLAAIVVRFDRPMRDQAWSVVGGGPSLPKITGKPAYDATRCTLTIPVELQPEWSYELWLNRGKFDSFQSAEGVKLMPVQVTFRTRGR